MRAWVSTLSPRGSTAVSETLDNTTISVDVEIIGILTVDSAHCITHLCCNVPGKVEFQVVMHACAP